ncbi:MAG: UpxY family transcription antiterminator [Bryobacteraceae bacterium]
MLLQASTTSPQYQVAEPALQFPWFGIRTRSNFEKTTSAFLASKGYQQYLPLYVQRRQWSDRAVDTRLPLFPGYVFCRFDPKCRTPILSTPGVFAIVGFGNEPAPIPDEEIDAIETVLKFGRGAEPCPFLREGQRVRIKSGSLEGLEGILTKKKNDLRIVVSVTMLQRSVAVEIDNDCIVTV